ncbi:MAG TPA: wax ester/triacylglycerol synthase family O-acyltransferase [Casimicrobiaceae bacterium]|nr:wax ester/triacylglycerol synthase family O-acyltransferase [Casimicrobiaceae bacterium]
MATTNPRSKRERLSSVDTAWLRMDRPSNLMIICGVLVLRERLALDRLRNTLEQRFLRFQRFRQRAVQGAGGACWQDGESFDLGHHLKRAVLPGRAGKAELEAFVSALVSQPLDPARPMWQFHLVERYEAGSAIVVRIHHSYADGIALIQVMLSLTDADRAGRMQGPAPPPREAASDGAPADSFDSPLSDALKSAMKTGSMLIEKGIGLWHDPARAVALAGQGQALTAEVVKLATMGEDSRTRFKGRPGVAKGVAWADPVPLADVKAIGRAYDCSINDVLLSAVAGAMRSYLVSHGDDVDGASLRALVPVNLRPPERAYQLGNRFGLVFLDLPLGIANPVERLYAVRANMRALKGSYQPVLSLGILAAMGAGPKALQEELLALLARNATAVMTNVPGPQQPLFLAGARIDAMMFWVPQSGDIGMGVSILSYDGAVQFGVIADRGLCPDPDRLIDRFAPEFDKLVVATLLSHWPWERPPSAPEVEKAIFGAA